MSVLVTGGAGYIGSHVVEVLEHVGEDVVIVDDLSSGSSDKIGKSVLIELDISSKEAPETLERVMSQYSVESVIHFAAKKQVGESVERPLFYYQQNIGGMSNLLTAMRQAAVRRLVFSSSAAAYGTLDEDLVTEDTPCNPISPYGETKLIGEWLATNCANSQGLSTASLRYFNVAGASSISMGDPTVFNVIPILFGHLKAKTRPTVFGNDYPTHDGTCVRDYVHVVDLAKAHVAALTWVRRDPAIHRAFNIGTGAGSSVLELIDNISVVTGMPINPLIGPRRDGDAARVVADVSRANDELGWFSTLGLTDMVKSAWAASCVSSN